MERISLKLKQVLWFIDNTEIVIIWNYGEDDEKCILNGIEYELTALDIIDCFKKWGEANVNAILAQVDEDGYPYLRIDIE